MLTIQRELFVRAMRFINDSKQRKDLIPILNYVYFSVINGSLVMRSTDLMTSVHCALPVDGGLTVGSFALPIQQLNNILKFSDGDICMRAEGNSIVFTGNTRYKINTGDVKLFPSIDFSLPSETTIHTGEEMRKLFTYCIADGFVKPLTYNQQRYGVIADKLFNFSLILPIGDLLQVESLVPARALRLASLWDKEDQVSYGVKDGNLIMFDKALSVIVKIQTEPNQFEGAMGNVLAYSQKAPILHFEITPEFLGFMANAGVFNRNEEDIRDVFFVVDPTRQAVGLYTECDQGVMFETIKTQVSGMNGEMKVLCVSLSRTKTLDFFAPKNRVGIIDNGKMVFFADNLWSLIALKNSPSASSRAEQAYNSSLIDNTPLFQEVDDARTH